MIFAKKERIKRIRIPNADFLNGENLQKNLDTNKTYFLYDIALVNPPRGIGKMRRLYKYMLFRNMHGHLFFSPMHSTYRYPSTYKIARLEVELLNYILTGHTVYQPVNENR